MAAGKVQLGLEEGLEERISDTWGEIQQYSRHRVLVMEVCVSAPAGKRPPFR